MTPLITERELSIEELASVLGSDDKVDYAVPADQVHVEFEGDKNAATRMSFPSANLGFSTDIVSHTMTEHAVGQFHGRLARGLKQFAEDLRVLDLPETYERTLSDVLAKTRERNGDPKTFRVRTLKNDNLAERNVRAVVSDSFKPIDDDVIFGTALPLIDPVRFRGIGGNKTDTRTVSKFIEREPSLTFKTGDRVRNMFFGFILGNSEVGSGSATFSMYVADSYCTNGCIFGKRDLANISYRHVGSKIDIRHGIIESSRVEKAELLSIQRLIHDATIKAMSLEGRDRIIKAMQDANDRQVTRESSEFFKDFGKAVGLTKKEAEQLPIHSYSDEFNQLGIQSAVTALAQTKPYERRLELEKIGGDIIMMPERRWNALAVA